MKIALFTGGSLRHKRFVIEMVSRFPSDITIVWVESKGMKRSNKQLVGKATEHKVPIVQANKKLAVSSLLSKIKTLGVKKVIVNTLFLSFEKLTKRMFSIFHQLMIKRAESFYYKELVRVEPTVFKKITTPSPNSDEIKAYLEKFEPDLFISFGGPIYKENIFGLSKIAINQHAGIAPKYKGSYTTEMALLHSDISNVGVTIHHVSKLADEGPIIKTEKLHVNEFDSPAKIFVRNCALGNELIFNVINDLLQNRVVESELQIDGGKTYLAKNFGAAEVVTLYVSYFFGSLRNRIKLGNYEN